MPTYEYCCTKCDHEFEKFQPIADAPLTVCPKELCGMKKWGKGKVKKMIGAGAGLIFKGSGFYITDYRSENYKESAKKESASASSSSGDGKTAAGGDAKPKAAASSGGESKSASPKSDTKPAKTAKPNT